jgi:hypothetical protein
MIRRLTISLSAIVALILVTSGTAAADSAVRKPGLDEAGSRPAATLGRLVRFFITKLGDTDLMVASEPSDSSLVLSGRTARITWMDSPILDRRVAGEFLTFPRKGELPTLRLDSPAPTRFFGYPDEKVAGITPAAGFIIELLRPARSADECAEMARSLVAMTTLIAAPLPPFVTAEAAVTRLQIFDDGAFQRDSFLLRTLFAAVGFPSPFDGFDRLWFGFRAAESEARLTRFEAPYARLIIKTGPARAMDRAFFTRTGNSIDLQLIDSDRRLSLLIESDRELAVSEAEVQAWIDLLTGRFDATSP